MKPPCFRSFTKPFLAPHFPIRARVCVSSKIGLASLVSLASTLRRVAGSENVVVVDADDLAASPSTTLGALCGVLGIQYLESMLSWDAGPKVVGGGSKVGGGGGPNQRQNRGGGLFSKQTLVATSGHLSSSFLLFFCISLQAMRRIVGFFLVFHRPSVHWVVSDVAVQDFPRLVLRSLGGGPSVLQRPPPPEAVAAAGVNLPSVSRNSSSSSSRSGTSSSRSGGSNK